VVHLDQFDRIKKHSYFSLYADANMGCLDHAHVIATVANCAYATLCILLQQINNLGFLSWRTAAHDHGRTCQDNINEFLFVVLQHHLIDDKYMYHNLKRARQYAKKECTRFRVPTSSDCPSMTRAVSTLRRKLLISLRASSRFCTILNS
jgi:hypothetical protein